MSTGFSFIFTNSYELWSDYISAGRIGPDGEWESLVLFPPLRGVTAQLSQLFINVQRTGKPHRGKVDYYLSHGHTRGRTDLNAKLFFVFNDFLLYLTKVGCREADHNLSSFLIWMAVDQEPA